MGAILKVLTMEFLVDAPGNRDGDRLDELVERDDAVLVLDKNN